MLDTWKPARKQLKLHNNRLATIAEYLQVEHAKTPIQHDHWLAAAHGDKQAVKYVKDHCYADVLVLEEVFVKMRPLFNEEPTRRLFVDDEGNEMTCVSCGSEHLHRRGYHVAKTRRYQRLQCQDCGKWQKVIKCEKSNPQLIVGI